MGAVLLRFGNSERTPADHVVQAGAGLGQGGGDLFVTNILLRGPIARRRHDAVPVH